MGTLSTRATALFKEERDAILRASVANVADRVDVDRFRAHQVDAPREVTRLGAVRAPSDGMRRR